ncbi:sn-glycerol-3-phosphate ABC transporter ATP-binding protein UgpC [Agrobacterium sp. B1(2019)]|uniref:ABC transporter ATP-binding protein n=1 Tax=Agrobacterium sp. B1(2019) TaxID=2607032 RepID=UPI0011EDAAD7|nr:sn-glycerol-3-phosphate ABC transporter ATP-binding protein UgpC [Agrobacterium sp. B1(2019)]TZG31233.1 sn-glycerol-3-phosphate ABC transporter ATP-binding protein UgpC [Agrobacterium sp. B1(2019)]
MAQVALNKLVKRYGSYRALHELDMTVDDGEFVVLVGPSGCGKSTLLRMIAGLEEISGGTISIGGRVVNTIRPKERDIAMVFQSYALYPHMTVRKNMSFALKLAGKPQAEIDTAVEHAAAILGLEPLLDRKPKQLSGGQRQRVAMGRAIVRNPQVFLFDEPLSNLDAKLRVQMRAEIKELHQRLGATTVYVTHDQIEAMTMADKIVVMRDGHIEQVGHPLDLYDRPANRFVAGFIGSPAMNFVAGQLERPEGQAFIASDGTRIPLPLRPDLPKDVDVVLAIRPEELAIVPQDSAMAFPATVSVVEATGPETVVIASACGTRLSVVVKERSRLRPGETIWLRPQQDKVQFFEATESGRRLSV